MLRHLRRFCRQTLGGGMFLLAAISPGCGSSMDAQNKAFVKGKVTLANRPLPSGLVVFTAANGWTANARIRPDGSYMIHDVPIGEVKIRVENVLVPPGEAGRGKFVPIPLRYNDPATSGLTYTVTAGGEQEKNIELTP